ncbi:MAG: VWA domain-containing protein [Candidatus Andersenbacteria bacterium]|nr:VWA domain-containing protein [Candidatus Andersenbacteria bacterium]
MGSPEKWAQRKLGEDLPPADSPAPQIPESPHGEAMEFVDRHQDFLKQYARGEVNIKPAPPGLDTFAFDLVSNDIYVNSRFYQERELSDEKTLFATLHEVEHFREKAQMVREESGQKTFTAYVEAIKESRAYGLMDNCVADIRENRTVISRTNESYAGLEQALYTEDLFPATDFRQDPRHIQFSQALLRESRVPGQPCEVAPEVREALDKLGAIADAKGRKLMDVMTHPDTPMSLRLKLQNAFIWPRVKVLLEQDLQEQEQKKGESEEGQPGEAGGEGQQTKSKTTTPGQNPNEIFKEAYDQADKRVPNAVPIEKIEEALGQWQKEKGVNALDKADAEYADKLGVKKADLQRYRQEVVALEKYVNPATGEKPIEGLCRLFERIIARRLKPAHAPRYPVEEGEDLVDPAQLVADVKAGNLEPKVWETTEMAERPGKRFGKVEIMSVADRSTSMNEDGGVKLKEQRRAVVMAMEALKYFGDRVAEERVNVDTPLEVKSAFYAFGSRGQDGTALKASSTELTEKQRVGIASVLSSAVGSTNDFVPLEAIAKGMTDEERQQIREGELKKIVVVFTDGDSDDKVRVQKALKKLRDSGVVAVGIGITEGGQAALTTYAPDARVAKQATELTTILGDLLAEHLADI